MSSKIFVGNLPWSVTSEKISEIVRDLGHQVLSARVVTERDTGRSRGFAFVEFSNQQAAEDATRDLDGHVVDGRALRASLANDKPGRGGGGRGAGRDGGGDRRGVGRRGESGGRRGGGGGDRYEVWDD